MGVLLPLAWSLYRARPVRVTVVVGTLGKQPALKAISIRVQRISNGPDHMQVVASLDPAAIASGTTLYVTVPTTFKIGPVDASSWEVHEAGGSDGRKDIHAKPASSNDHSGCTFDFTGEIVPKASSVDIQFGIFGGHNGREVQVPTELTIADLDDIAFDQLIPEPEQRTSRFIWYTLGLWREKIADGVITLRGTDRAAAVRSQFYLFVVATLIGVFASLVTNLAQAFVAAFELADD